LPDSNEQHHTIYIDFDKRFIEADVNYLLYVEKVLSSLNITVWESYVVTLDKICSIRGYRKAQQETEWEEASKLLPEQGKQPWK